MPSLYLLLLRAGFILMPTFLIMTAAVAAEQTATATASTLATVVAQRASVARETAFDAAVEAIDQSTVAAQTNGRVMELFFDVGDYVEKGAVILRLTAVEQRARTEAAEAALAEARARLAEVELTYRRIKEVYDKKLIAKADYDKAAADLSAARARVEAAQAARTQAQEDQGYTLIRAPYPGIVVARLVQVGETVSPGKPLMTGVSLERLRAVVEIPQQHVGPLRKHRKARVILPDGRSLEAAAIRFPPTADPVTHTFSVRVDLPPGEHGVFPGMLVKVAFVSGEEERLLIPGTALLRRGELTGAYVMDDQGHIALRYLRVGTPTADGRVPVLSGLDAGERITTDPVAAAIASKRSQQREDAE
jgi:RND family efflux transporter MFP subunit